MIDKQRQYLIQELDVAIESLERELGGDSVRKATDRPEHELHELIRQMEGAKKELDACLHAAVAGGLESPLDDILLDLSSPIRKPVTTQVELHPRIVSAQTILSNFAISLKAARQIH